MGALRRLAAFLAGGFLLVPQVCAPAQAQSALPRDPAAQTKSLFAQSAVRVLEREFTSSDISFLLLDARSGGQPAPSAMYMNEALWPSQQKADEWTRAERPEEIKKVFAEVSNGVEIEKTVRYVDAEG